MSLNISRLFLSIIVILTITRFSKASVQTNTLAPKALNNNQNTSVSKFVMSRLESIPDRFSSQKKISVLRIKDKGIGIYVKETNEHSEFLVNMICWILDVYFMSIGKYQYPHVSPPLMFDRGSLYMIEITGSPIPDKFVDANFNSLPVFLEEGLTFSGSFAKYNIKIGMDFGDDSNMYTGDLDNIINHGYSSIWKHFDYDLMNVSVHNAEISEEDFEDIASILGLDLALILKEGISILKLLGTDKFNVEARFQKLQENYLRSLMFWFDEKIELIKLFDQMNVISDDRLNYRNIFFHKWISWMNLNKQNLRIPFSLNLSVQNSA